MLMTSTTLRKNPKVCESDYCFCIVSHLLHVKYSRILYSQIRANVKFVRNK